MTDAKLHLQPKSAKINVTKYVSLGPNFDKGSYKNVIKTWHNALLVELSLLLKGVTGNVW